MNELELAKDDKNFTHYDLLHMANRKAGRDRQTTLREIRSGNTQRRVDQFENM